MGVDVLKFIGLCDAVTELYAFQELLLVLFLEGGVQDHLVDLLLVVGGVGELFGHLSVVGEHKDAGGVLVQTANGEYPGGAALEEIHHCFICVRVAGGGDIALGLIHHDIDLLFTLEALSVEADVVSEDVHLGAKFRHNLSVHGYNTALDHCIGLPAGADAGIGDEFVEAHHFLYFGGGGVVVTVMAVHLGLTAKHGVHAFLGAVPLLEGLAISGSAAGTSGF